VTKDDDLTKLNSIIQNEYGIELEPREVEEARQNLVCLFELLINLNQKHEKLHQDT